MRARRSRPELLLGGGDVTAKVVSHERGPKIRIGKYRRRTGYKRHNGFRAAITRIQIESIAGGKAASEGRRAKKADAPKAVETAVVETAAVETRRGPERRGRRAGLPEGYESFTVAQIQAGTRPPGRPPSSPRRSPTSRSTRKRKGALAALTSAIEKEGDA